MGKEISLPKIPGFNRWWIDPGKVIGGPSLAYVNVKEITDLFDMGVANILNLQDGRSDPDYMKHVKEWEGKTGKKIGFLNVGIVDGQVPTKEQVSQAIGYIRESLQKPSSLVYVHCAAGHGRTGTIAGCWLREQGIPADKVLDLLVARRYAGTSDDREVPETAAQRKLVTEWTSSRV